MLPSIVGQKNLERPIGSDCLLMASTHVAHDCIVGDNVIMSNLSTLGGHVEVGDWAILGGGVLVHQFTKIGSHVLIGDFEQYKMSHLILAADHPLKYKGVNLVGLKRRGFSSEDRKSIKEIYKIYFKSGLNRGDALNKIQLRLNPQLLKIRLLNS